MFNLQTVKKKEGIPLINMKKTSTEMETIQIGYNEVDLISEKEYDKRKFASRCFDSLLGRKKHFARSIYLSGITSPENQTYPANVVRNQKYNLLTFLPVALFEQFKYFFNFYYL